MPEPGEASSSGKERPDLPTEAAAAGSNTAGSATKPAHKPGPPSPPYIVLTGNPNSGKTTLFNALTGLRAKVGNYAGVTVERKEGRLLGAPASFNARVLDLPGTYSLSPQSLDEQISRDVLAQPPARIARALGDRRGGGCLELAAQPLLRHPGDRAGVSDADCAEHD
jgi:hypothetical protein